MKRTGKRRDPLQISALFAELNLMLSGGISLWESAQTLEDSAQDGEGRALGAALREAAEAGGRLSDGLERAGGFPEYAVEMVRVGQNAGRLPDVLTALSQFYENRDALRKAVRSAVAYPLGMAAMVLVVVGVLLTQVLPIFSRVFEQLGVQMSAAGEGLLVLGQGLQLGVIVLMGLLVVLGVTGVCLWKTPKGRAFLLRAGSGLPHLAKLNALMEGQRFAYAVSLLLRSGLPAEDALESARKLTSREDTRAKIAAMQQQMLKGDSFETALLASGIIPREFYGLLKVSFRTGVIDATLQRISDLLFARTQDALDGFIAAFEPTLVCLMCLVAGAVLLSVMLPLMSVLAGL